MAQHRHVDGFTDARPLFVACRRAIAYAGATRFTAGIHTDISWDHVLSSDLATLGRPLCGLDLEPSCAEIYAGSARQKTCTALASPGPTPGLSTCRGSPQMRNLPHRTDAPGSVNVHDRPPGSGRERHSVYQPGDDNPGRFFGILARPRGICAGLGQTQVCWRSGVGAARRALTALAGQR